MEWSAYFILFLSAFAAATLLPMQSEAILLGLLTLGQQSPFLLILVATIGNVLGSCMNWYLGYRLEKFKHYRWFPFKEKQIVQAQKYYAKYGSAALLLSWVPIIGDPITLISGILKEKFLRFIIIVTFAKALRYLCIYLLL